MAASPEITPRQCSEIVKRLAGSFGFSACGVCRADPIDRREYVLDWLAAGRHGQMAYLQRNVDVRLNPALLLPGARSVIVVAWLYRVRETAEGLPEGVKGDPATGQIARYAWGRDYHRVIRGRLHVLVDEMRRVIPGPFETRVCVDTAPLLERELAQRAGVGWIGNNCLVLNRDLGSYFCLGAVVTTLEIAPDEPGIDRCGTCDRCVKACPTGALLGGKQMDASRCISYHTIEQRANPNPDAPTNLAGQLFGCDICQQACPYNGERAAVTEDPDAQPRQPAAQVDPAEVLTWAEADWDAFTRGRSLRRASLEMWKRNAQALLGRSDANGI